MVDWAQSTNKQTNNHQHNSTLMLSSVVDWAQSTNWQTNKQTITSITQPYCNPLWLTGLKAPTDKQTNNHQHKFRCRQHVSCLTIPQWGATDAEIKVPSGENTERKRSPFKALSRSVYSHKCYAYCQGFFPCLFLPFQSIHLHFFQNLSRFVLCWLWLTLIPV